MAASPWLPELRELNLRNNQLATITDAGVRALVDSPHLQRLTLLELRDNHITERWC